MEGVARRGLDCGGYIVGVHPKGRIVEGLLRAMKRRGGGGGGKARGGPMKKGMQ